MKNKKANVGTILWVLLIIALIIGSIAWTWYQWHLCREAGLSFWYCVQHTG